MCKFDKINAKDYHDMEKPERHFGFKKSSPRLILTRQWQQLQKVGGRDKMCSEIPSTGKNGGRLKYKQSTKHHLNNRVTYSIYQN